MVQQTVLCKSQHLYEKIRLELGQGGFGKGQKYYSITELANRFKVAPGTAQKVLRELVEDGYLSATQGKGHIVISCPDVSGLTASKSIKPNVVCYVMRGELIHSQTAKIIACLSALCAGRGWKMEISSNSENSISEIFLRSDVVGVFIESTIYSISHVENPKNKPIICIGHWQGETDNVISVTSDAPQIGKTLIRYLFSLGHRRIGILGIVGEDGAMNNIFLNKLYEGLKEGCADQGLPWDAIHFAIDDSGQGGQYVSQSISNFIDLKVTAVFALTWTTVLIFVQQVLRQGLTIPGDFSIVSAGESDVTPYIHPKITRFDFGINEICKKAIHVMSNVKDQIHQRGIYLPSELLFGESTGAPAFSNERERSIYC